MASVTVPKENERDFVRDFWAWVAMPKPVETLVDVAPPMSESPSGVTFHMVPPGFLDWLRDVEPYPFKVAA